MQRCKVFFAIVPPGCVDGSLLVRVAGDWRSLLPGPSAGVLQLLHPAIGAGVMEHSAFIDDPFGRVYRSIPQIWATLLASDGDARGRRIRDLHHAIKGVDHNGERYHALDAEVFWWAHATFTWEMFRAVELYFRRRWTGAEREQLYAETVDWYRGYGMSMRPVPADHGAFTDKFDSICRHELQLTPAAERTIEQARRGGLDAPALPPTLNRVVRAAAGPPARAMLFCTLPPSVRVRFRLDASPGDRRRFRFVTAAVPAYFALVPAPVNRATLEWALRRYGAYSRPERYVPPAPRRDRAVPVSG